MYRFIWLVCSLLLPVTAQAASPHGCVGPVYHQFDFWVGNWTVVSPAGRYVGHNHVVKSYSGCVVQENWSGAKGGTGGSFNIYDAKRKVWHQTWVDSSGTLLILEGGLHNGSMVMSGEQTQTDGSQLLNRITWTPEHGTVRQVWETSSDGGKTWKKIFDGIYIKNV